MRTAALGICVVLLLWATAVNGFGEPGNRGSSARDAGSSARAGGDRSTIRDAAAGTSVGTGNELIAISTVAGDERQQVAVIDPKTRTMSVYHIDLASGAISLKSVRNIQWDLQLVEFNGVSPLPREIRSLLEEN